MRRIFFALVALFFSMAGLAVADEGVGNGTVLEGTLSSNLSSATSQVGDPVVITGVRDSSGGITGTLYGHVTSVQKGGQGSHPQLSFVLDRLVTADSTFSVTAQSRGIRPPGVSAGKATTSALLGALAGALIGKAVGHSSGAIIAGAVAGAGAGFLLTSNNYQDIALQQGSTVSVLLTSVTRAQSH